MAKWIKRNNIKVEDDLLLIEKLAKIRKIDDVGDWMNPSQKHENSPYKLLNIDKAVEMIVQAIYNKKNITIVADIDTDGVCSTGIMFNYLKEMTDKVRYIHAQRSDGHGVETVLDQITDEDDLIVIVDSSSNSVEGCKELWGMGLDIVIIDHHQITEDNPFATIVNCQMGDYPNKNLSGSGMCYKVCQVLDEYLGVDLADEFLDLSAIGIIADMMDVRNMENRYLILKGIDEIKNIGIGEILRQSKVDYKYGINSTNISFKIAPIIGACSRFDKIELALELVTTDDIKRAKELVKEMIQMNERRKAEQKEYVERAVEEVDSSHNVIIYIDEDIDSGFRGLIATEFTERFNKPTFVLTHFESEGKYVGSARSVGEIPLQSMCIESDLFHFAQGHEGAFGVSFSDDKLEEIISYFDVTLDSTDLQKVFKYDLEISADDIDDYDIKEVEKFSRIVGQGFPEPKFLVRGLTADEGYTKKLGNHVRAVMGKNDDTVKINCENEFALMKFRTQEMFAKEVEDHFYDSDNFITELDVIGSLNLNRFYNGGLKRWVVTKQVFIDDFKII